MPTKIFTVDVCTGNIGVLIMLYRNLPNGWQRLKKIRLIGRGPRAEKLLKLHRERAER